jgi:hypothetical protein
MPFPATSGILMPADVHLIHSTYSEISAEPWFTADPERREQFAMLVIDAYREGRTDPEDLIEYFRNIALQRFGNAAALRDFDVAAE